MKSHRRKVVNKRHSARILIEALESRQLLSALGSDGFTFQQAPDLLVRINSSGDLITEVIGAWVDDRNNVVLTDIPGRLGTTNTGRSNLDMLGGVGGANGADPVNFIVNGADTDIIDPFGASFFVDSALDRPVINFRALASNKLGATYGISRGVYTAPGGAATDYVHLATMDLATGQGNVTTTLHKASLEEDVIGDLVPNPTQPGLPASLINVRDMAADPTQPGLIYVVNEEATGSTLYVVDTSLMEYTFIGSIAYAQDPLNPVTLTGVEAMAFDDAGELYILTRDFDGDPNTDTSGLAIDDEDPPNTTNWDVAYVHVDKTTGEFVQADAVPIITEDEGLELVNQIYTAMTFWTSGGQTVILGATEEKDTSGTGGGTPTDPEYELQMIFLDGRMRSMDQIQAGSERTRIEGFTWAEDATGATVLVAIDDSPGDPGAGVPGGPRLIIVDPDNPGDSLTLGAPNSIADVFGLAAWREDPTDPHPLLFTVFSRGAQPTQLIRGSAITLPYDAESGDSMVISIPAADFDPLDDTMLYFVVEANQANAGGGGGGGTTGSGQFWMYRVNINPGVAGLPSTGSRTSIQNSMQLVGLLEGANGYAPEIRSFTFDEDATAPNGRRAYAIDNAEARLLELQFNFNPAIPTVGIIQRPVIQENLADLDGLNVTALELFGDDPLHLNGDDPATASEYLYATVQDGDSTRIMRILKVNPGTVPDPALGNQRHPTAIYWGGLTDAQGIDGLTWNSLAINPYTQERGGLIGVDDETDQLVFIDHRLRPDTINLYSIHSAQSNTGALMTIYQFDPNTGNPMPYTGSIGDFRERITYDGSDPFVAPNADTGAVLVGALTKDVDNDTPNLREHLVPITQVAVNGRFGMVSAGPGNIDAGVYVPTNMLELVATPTDLMIGLNLDRIVAASSRSDGLIALIDSDLWDANFDPIDGLELGVIDPGTTAASASIGVYELIPDPDPFAPPGATIPSPIRTLHAMDWGDPAGAGESLYVVYEDVNGDVQFGTLDADSTSASFGQVTPLGAFDIGGPLPVAMAISGVDLWVVDDLQALRKIDATGAADAADPNVPLALGVDADPDAATTILVRSIEFDPATGTLYAFDVQNGRLVDIDLVTGQFGNVTASLEGSIRAGVQALLYDAAGEQFVAMDDSVSRESLLQSEATSAESAMLVSLRGLTNDDIVKQDFDKFLLGGTLTGRVDISGNVDTFYNGWLLAGNVGVASAGAGIGGLVACAIGPDNFTIGGELRDLLVMDSIGSDGAAFTSQFDMDITGRVGQVMTRESFLGGVEVWNEWDSPFFGREQFEIEMYADPAQLFVSGTVAHSQFYNDTFASPQYLGTINSVDGTDPYSTDAALLPLHLNNVVQVIGHVGAVYPPGGPYDPRDYYGVSLLAGQKVVVQLSPFQLDPFDTPIAMAHVSVFDPDGRMIATDWSDMSAGVVQWAPFEFTADRPGVYRFVVSDDPDLEADEFANANYGDFGRYQLTITDGQTAVGDLAVGAIYAAGSIALANYGGNDRVAWIHSGHFGALQAVGTVSAGSGLAPFEVSAGDVRSMHGYAVGSTLEVFGTAGEFYGTEPSPPPPDLITTFVGGHVGKDIQLIHTNHDLSLNLLVDRGIGVIRADTMDLSGPSWIEVNADWNTTTNAAGKRDGFIDLIDVAGQVGTFAGGGPAITTHPGGNVRYMRVGGPVYRDLYFGRGEPEATLHEPGEVVVLTDDSGAKLKVTPGPIGRRTPQAQQPFLTVTTYGVRGSGGSVILNITSSDGAQLRSTARSGSASVEIGTVQLNGAGQAVEAGPNGRLVLSNQGTPLMYQADGTARIDVLDLRGGAFSFIQDDTGGEIVNVTADSIGRMEADTLGVARLSVSQSAVNPLGVISNVFPFNQQNTGVVSGDIVYARAERALGNFAVDGTIQQMVADADGKADRSDSIFEGIVGPIYATGEIRDITVGEGILPSGTGNLAYAGIFADGAIGYVRGKRADIRGDIMSLASITRIHLTEGSAIINADIMVTDALSGSREFAPMPTIPEGTPDPVNNPTYDIGDIYVEGGLQRRGQPAPLNGGIIGSQFWAGDIGTIRVRRGFGVVNSFFQVTGDGRMKDFLIEGYGLRDVNILAGASIGRINATGNGTSLAPQLWTSSVRWSESMIYEKDYGQNISRQLLNVNQDLHMYLLDTDFEPANDADLSSGVIAGTTVAASRDLTGVQAYRVAPSYQMSQLGIQTRIDVANTTKNFVVAENVYAMELTTGELKLFRTGGSMMPATLGLELVGSRVIVAGELTSMQIFGDVADDTWIEAIGPNGEIKNLLIRGVHNGTVRASVDIGRFQVTSGVYGPHAGIYVDDVKLAPLP